MVNIEKICKDLDKNLTKYNTKEEVLEDCIFTRLNTLYNKQSEKYDIMIDSIYRMIDSDNITDMCTVLKKLSKNINSNRQQLVSLIERMK